LSTVYLVRHGQAGTRQAYDSLSPLGKQQARSLGEHFVSQGVRFAFACCGAMTRQQQTAAEVSRVYAEIGIPFPVLTVDPGWDEFDLGLIYEEIAPQLSEADPEFRREYEQMRDQARSNAGRHAARVHRKWLPCDTKLVDAWIAGRYQYSGETWQQFRERVAACQAKIVDSQERQEILVVTSATPIAVWAGLSLEITDDRLMRLAGVLYNASYSVMRLREGQIRLFTFNAVPHLGAPGLRTHR